MGEIIEAFGEGFTGIIPILANGIKEGFTNLLYVDPTVAEPVLSPVAQVGLLAGGLGLGISLIFGLFSLVRRIRG